MPPKRKYYDDLGNVTGMDAGTIYALSGATSAGQYRTSNKAKGKRKAEPMDDWEKELRAVEASCGLSSSASTSKKPRAKKVKAEDAAEKRLARYRATCPKVSRQRVQA